MLSSSTPFYSIPPRTTTSIAAACSLPHTASACASTCVCGVAYLADRMLVDGLVKSICMRLAAPPLAMPKFNKEVSVYSL